MMASTRWMAGAALVGAAFLLGCDDYPPKAKTSPTSPPPATQAEGQSQQPKVATGPELTDEDKALIAAQNVCPVSGEELGSVGPPVKVTVQGETFFLCCPDCRKKVDADPEKYIAKVKELRKANSPAGEGQEKPSDDGP